VRRNSTRLLSLAGSRRDLVVHRLHPADIRRRAEAAVFVERGSREDERRPHERGVAGAFGEFELDLRQIVRGQRPLAMARRAASVSPDRAITLNAAPRLFCVCARSSGLRSRVYSSNAAS
jgi:hypothetical protein